MAVMLVHEIKHLVLKDIRLEVKQKYAINGIILYVVSTVFVCYLSFSRIIEPETWNSLFWIILLFASVSAVSKSFVQEGRGRQLYYYSIASSQSVILSKIIYNLLLTAILSLFCFGVFALLMSDVIVNHGIFFTALILGSFGFASILTMVSAIASRTDNNFTLMAVLSFPLVFPLLITLMSVSKNALGTTTWAANSNVLLVILLINTVVVLLSYLLFPYLWRD